MGVWKARVRTKPFVRPILYYGWNCDKTRAVSIFGLQFWRRKDTDRRLVGGVHGSLMVEFQ